MDPLTLSRRRELANYSFSASAEVSRTGVTHIPYASQAAPFAVLSATPTILRQFGAEHPLFPEALASMPVESASGIFVGPASVASRISSRAPSVFSRQQTPVLQRESRQPTPVPHNLGSRAPTPAPTAVSRVTPAPSILSVRTGSVHPTEDGGDEHGDAERGAVRPFPNTRLSARSRSVPPDNFGDFLPPQTAGAGPSTRSGSVPTASIMKRTISAASSVITIHSDPDPMGFVRNFKLCQLTDEEKTSANGRKGKSQQERPYTAWYESTADEPRASPPDLTIRPDLTLGDIFWHKSARGIQLWVWVDTPNKGLHWKPVLIGHPRGEDGRRLTLTPNDKPSWISDAWYRKKEKQLSKLPVFILKK